MNDPGSAELQQTCRAPFLQDDAFLAEVRRRVPEAGDFRLWWLGQSGFLLAWNGTCALLDPYLSDSLTRKYAASNTPHVRLVERVVHPARLDFIHFVTASHGHTDHLDADTLRPLVAGNPSLHLIAPAAVAELARGRSGLREPNLLLMDAGQTVELAGFSITAIASAHESVEYDAGGHSLYLGYVLRFGSWTVYHSGDTIPHPALVPALRQFSIDVALLPINGRSPARGVAGNLDAAEAAQLARAIDARVAIPCHYDMFAFNTADPEDFRAQAAARGQPCRILPVGGSWGSCELRSSTPGC